MGRITVILFFIGILIEALAFIGSKAEDIPFVLSIVSPSYANAKDGLSEMERTMVLLPNQDGFIELSAIFYKNLVLWNPGRDVSSLSVVKITRKKANMTVGTLHAKEVVPLIFTMSNGQDLKWELGALMEDVNNLKAKHLFFTSIVVFVIGIGIQILGFILGRKENRQTPDSIC